MRQMLKQPQNNVVGNSGTTMNLKIVLNQEFLFEPPKNTCQIFQPKKIRESKISNPKNTFDHLRYREIWSTAPGI